MALKQVLWRYDLFCVLNFSPHTSQQVQFHGEIRGLSLLLGEHSTRTRG